MKLTMRATATLGKKVTLITAAFVLAVSTLTAAVPFMLAKDASALGEISISNVAELRTAIENQADGQVWNVQSGQYGLSPFNSISAGGQTGWYFPVTADNLTINGVGNPTIYGIGYSANGNWSTQNLVSVFGDNVSISGFTFMPKISPNKTIEVLGDNFTLRNTTIEPNTVATADYGAVANLDDRAWDQQWGGSLYFNHAGNHTIENVTIKNAGVSFRYAPAGTHINFNNVVIENTSNDDFTNAYRYSSAFNNSGNSTTNLPTVVYNVNNTLNNLDSVLASVQDGDVINLDSDISVTKQLSLKKAVTLNGNGHTITGNYVKTNGSNNSVVAVLSDDVVINNLTVDGVSGTANMLHGINVYESQDVTLANITAKNGRSGVAVNGSTVTIDSITTSGNVWHGINVDRAGALTIKGSSQHTDTVPSIYIDHVTAGTVNDVNDQYAVINNPADNNNYTDDRAFYLKLETPALESPSNNGYTTSNVFDFEWTDVSGAVSYEFQNSKVDTVVDGVLSSVNFTATTADSKLLSSGAADGSVRYWQVRAVDANGAKSDWSAPWKMTIDMTAPAAPTLTSPADNTFVNGGPVQKWSHSNAADVDHYVYESYSNSTLTNLIYSADTTATQRKIGGTQNVEIWWRVAAVDQAGNQSAWSQVRKLTVDNSNPAVELDNFGTSAVRGTVDVEGSVTDNFALSHYNLSLYDGAVDLSDGGTHAGNRIATGTQWVTGGQTNVTGTDVSVARSLDTTALSDGLYQIRLAAKDKAGNTSVKYFSFVVDNKAPVVTLDNLSTTSTSPVLTGTIDDPTATVVVMIDATPFTAVNNGDGTWTLVLASVTPGLYQIAVSASDIAGNTSGASGTLSVVTTTDNTGSNGSNGDTSDATTTTTNVAVTLPNAIGPVDQAALGVSDEIPAANNEAVEGASAEKTLAQAVDADANKGIVMGLAWYWWLLILAGIALILWWIIAAIRRRQSQDA